MGRIISAVLAGLLLAGCVGNRAAQGPVVVTYLDQDQKHTQKILDRSNRAIERIARFWNVDFDDRVQINVDPGVTRSTAYYDDKFINLSSVEVAFYSSVIEHEIAHLVLDRDGANRQFMNEGIAVYCEMMFKDEQDASAEQLAERIDGPARKGIARTGYLPLEHTEVAIDDKAGRYFSRRVTAYYEAASFVKYMIDTYGLESFKRAYSGLTFDRVYGKSIGELEAEWLEATFPDLGGRELALSAREQAFN